MSMPTRLHPDLQVDGETELVRYMKPTALLLLLAGKVFIRSFRLFSRWHQSVRRPDPRRAVPD
jgi:hypothetical protein